MAATPSLKVLKSMDYRGGTRVWSNRYHFLGGTPADAGHWTTFSDAVVAAEKALYDAGQINIKISGSVGYDAGSDVPVFSKSYSVAGTAAFTSAAMAPGDCAALLRFDTDQRTSKNHPIYLFNYFHGVHWDSSSSEPDNLNAGQKSAILTYGNAWIAGFSDGTNTYTRAGPNGASALGAFVETYITHRDFPR